MWMGRTKWDYLTSLPSLPSSPSSPSSSSPPQPPSSSLSRRFVYVSCYFDCLVLCVLSGHFLRILLVLIIADLFLPRRFTAVIITRPQRKDRSTKTVHWKSRSLPGSLPGKGGLIDQRRSTGAAGGCDGSTRGRGDWPGARGVDRVVFVVISGDRFTFSKSCHRTKGVVLGSF